MTPPAHRLALILAAAVWLMVPLASAADAPPRPPTYCNPVDLPYRFQPDRLGWRTAADPAVAIYKGEYWLFATKSGGYWHSADCVHWRFVGRTMLPLENDAPAVFVRDGKLYWTAINVGLYATDDPAGGNWAMVNAVKSRGDPDLFGDDDGRVYLYAGCSDRGPIDGQELDPTHGFAPLTPAHGFFKSDIRHHGAEVPAEPTAPPPYKTSGCWIEGPWMTKHGGKYYLQYSAPATEYKTYGDGVYVADGPMGPFAFAPYSPFSFKPTGFAAGVGHSTTFQDPGGRYWRMSSMTVSVRHKFERRLGLFPAWFTPDGQMVCDTCFGDYPQFPPGTVADPSRGNSPGWMLLSYAKSATASSTLDGHPLADAFNEDIRSWWSARTGDAGEWLGVDLGKPCRVDAVQVNFGDEGATERGRLADGYGYTLDLSADGRTWATAVDRRADRRDAPHDYVQLDRPVTARYARLTNAHTPAGAKFSVSGLRLFGSGLGTAPAVPAGVHVTRDPADARQATIGWDPVPNVDGYVVRYGVAKDKLFSNYQVYGTDRLHIHTLNVGVPYFFTVDAFNDTAVAKGAAVTPG